MDPKALLPGSNRDVAVAALGLALALTATWMDPNPVGTTVAGPTWLRVLFPLALGLPLAWRRRAPLAVLLVVLGGVVVHALVTQDSPEGLELIICVGVAMFSAAAYSPSGRSALALVAGAIAYVVYAANNVNIRSGRSSELWAGAFFAVALVAVWLAGVFVRARRVQALAAQETATREHEIRRAVGDERARLARELHDVVSHNLSVVVLQAAGARASGEADPTVLEKIERSGRDSLVEMRRLLGVLRDDGSGSALAPQPGLRDLDALATSVRTTGMHVDLEVSEGREPLPTALELSVFRIVQEALTNVLKHAGATRVEVSVRVGPEDVVVRVQDDGTGARNGVQPGHGLVGMRERVAMFRGDLATESPAHGGFVVIARMPLEHDR